MRLRLLTGMIATGLILAGPVFAEEEVTEPSIQDTLQEIKGELAEGRDDLKDFKSDAREEEALLRQMIREAHQNGDQELADSLREDLRLLHQENLGKFKEKRELHDLKSDLRKDFREGVKSGEIDPENARERFDRREDIRDKKEDRFDRREDMRDAKMDRGPRDRLEDRGDRREDFRDYREDRRDHREDRLETPVKMDSGNRGPGKAKEKKKKRYTMGGF